jgi:hypothetical protein
MVNHSFFLAWSATLEYLYKLHLYMEMELLSLGLRFLQHSVQTTFIHEKGITFIPYQDNVPYISEV